MKEFKGTKGEWTYLQQLGEVASKPSGLIADLVVNGEEDHNGRLIAAAPELFEALRQLRDYVEDMHSAQYGHHWKDESHPMFLAGVAINKALGKD